LWAQQDQAILDDFSALVKKQYGADIGRVDFIGAPDAAVKQINIWAARATRDKIPAAIDRQHVDSLTRLVLVNAVYFLGKWDQPFDGDDTGLLAFFRAPDDEIRVPTMRQQDTFRFAHADGVKVLHMPYQGAKLSMILILPDAIDGLADVESRLTADSLRTWEQTAKNTEVRVWLPKFKFAGDLQLRGALAELGMSSAFEASHADFSAIAGKDSIEKQPLFIQHVIHRAVVELDEKGTEAAATTVGTTTTTSKEPREPPAPPPEFRADHPFLFLLVDHETGAILFMGRVADPSKI
jgi:serpin B